MTRKFAVLLALGAVAAGVAGASLGLIAAVMTERLRGALGMPIDWEGADDGTW